MMSSFVAVRAMRTAINSGVISSCTQSYATTSKSSKQKKTVTSGTSSSTGMSLKNVDPPSNIFKTNPPKEIGPKGTGKDASYKNPEYFLYTIDSYAEMEVAMAKLRNPQPVARSAEK